MDNGHTPIVICADDYGLSMGVCDAIERLIAQGRLSATGAMTGMEGWRRRAGDFRQLIRQHPADVGVHFTLTGQRPLTPARGLAQDGRLPEIGTLILRAYSGTLPRAAIRDELRAQLDAFEDAWNAPPDFLDGHQHAHGLPGIREIVVEELARRYAGTGLWLRNCREPAAWARRRGHGWRKALLIGTLTAGTARQAAARDLPSNDSFRGLYDFGLEPGFRTIFRAALQGPGKRVLVHCHPGTVDEELRRLDPLLDPRERELAYLVSESCGDDLTAARVRPARFRETGAGASLRP